VILCDRRAAMYREEAQARPACGRWRPCRPQAYILASARRGGPCISRLQKSQALPQHRCQRLSAEHANHGNALPHLYRSIPSIYCDLGPQPGSIVVTIAEHKLEYRRPQSCEQPVCLASLPQLKGERPEPIWQIWQLVMLWRGHVWQCRAHVVIWLGSGG
jgi:hypothetical protein